MLFHRHAVESCPIHVYLLLLMCFMLHLHLNKRRPNKWSVISSENFIFFFLHFVVLYEEALCVKMCFKWKTGIIWDGMFKVSWSLTNNILHQNVISIIKSIIFNYLYLCMHFILVCLLLKYDVFLSEKVYSARLSIRIWYDGAKYVFLFIPEWSHNWMFVY